MCFTPYPRSRVRAALASGDCKAHKWLLNTQVRYEFETFISLCEL